MIRSLTQAALEPAGPGSREEDDARMILGQPSLRGTLRTTIAAQIAAREKAHRRAVMSAARDRRRIAIAAQREEDWFAPLAPLAAFEEDDARGLVPRSTETVVETITEPDTKRGGRHVLKHQLQAPGYMVRVERLFREYSGQRAIVRDAMAHEAGGGHSGYRVASTVNAEGDVVKRSLRVRDAYDARPAEDRSGVRGGDDGSLVQFAADVAMRNWGGGSRRIAGEPLKRLLSGEPLTARHSTAPADGSVRVIAADGTVTVRPADWFAPSDDAEGRRDPGTVSAADARRSRLMSAAGTVVMAEVD